MADKQSGIDEERYQLLVVGHIASHWFTALCDVQTIWDDDGVTRLVAQLPDQAALHGLLARIRDLGLILLSVERLSDQRASESDDTS